MKPIAEYRRLAVELVEYATGGSAGRSEADPVYQAVTEGRDRGAAQKAYSSCGDLAHWLLYRLGVRLPLVNRTEHQGWASGRNVSRLAFAKGLAVADPKGDARYEPGDVVIVWSQNGGTDAHVMVVLEDRQPSALLVGEYGQPGAHVRARPVHLHGGLLCMGVRALHAALPLDHVLEAADAAGKLVEPEDAETWALRLGLSTSRATEPPLPDPRSLPVLRKGSTGPAVRLLQERLNLKAQRHRLAADGVFGPAVEAELKTFQKARALNPDGVCGALTWQEVLS
jgi:hypothetical protein